MSYTLRGPYLYASDGRQVRIIGRTRRHVTVATARGAVQLSRHALERTGEDVSGGVAYRVDHLTYILPPSPKRDIRDTFSRNFSSNNSYAEDTENYDPYVPNGDAGDDPWTH